MKKFVKLLMRQTALWGSAATILILLGAATHAEEAAPTGTPPDGYIFPINRKSAETFSEMKEQRLKAAQAQKAKEMEKQEKRQKQEKVDKIQRKTGRTTTSWQVMNR
jgi:hypothetical protein